MASRGRPSVAVLALLLGGCDIILGLDRNDTIGGDAAPPPPPLPCNARVIDDSFDGPAVCPWGGPSEHRSSVTLASGQLRVAPDPDEVSYGGCTQATVAAMGPAGIVVEIASLLAAPSGYLVVHAYAVTAGEISASLNHSGGTLSAFDATTMVGYGTVEVASTVKQWWRIRPAVGERGLLAEYSLDGEHFERVGLVTGSVPAQVKLDFGAGTFQPERDPGVARFDRVAFCGP
ncbi:MAG: hypothetical protein M3680_14185 [Myxococcota bacterium]|nr:hypothetical protein [Myxococcota bacterium]